MGALFVMEFSTDDDVTHSQKHKPLGTSLNFEVFHSFGIDVHLYENPIPIHCEPMVHSFGWYELDPVFDHHLVSTAFPYLPDQWGLNFDTME